MEAACVFSGEKLTYKGSTFGQVGLLKNGECSPMQFCMEIPKLCSKSAKRFWGTRKSVPKIDTGFALSDLRRCQQPLPIGGVAQWQASNLSRYDVGGSIPPAVMLFLPILPFCFASSRLLSFCFGYTSLLLAITFGTTGNNNMTFSTGGRT